LGPDRIAKFDLIPQIFITDGANIGKLSFSCWVLEFSAMQKRQSIFEAFSPFKAPKSLTLSAPDSRATSAPSSFYGHGSREDEDREVL
jgi:hypothetical protein